MIADRETEHGEPLLSELEERKLEERKLEVRKLDVPI